MSKRKREKMKRKEQRHAAPPKAGQSADKTAGQARAAAPAARSVADRGPATKSGAARAKSTPEHLSGLSPQ